MPASRSLEMSPQESSRELPAEPTEKWLAPDERVAIDLETPLADREEVQRQLGAGGPLVANVDAGGKRFYILDMRETDSNRDFYIADDTFSMPERRGFKGVLEDEPVTIGRNHHTERFAYPGTVSGDHFGVTYHGGELAIDNLRPTNKTLVTARLAPEYDNGPLPEDVADIRTEAAVRRAERHPAYGEKDQEAPYGYYMNHPILGRRSRSVDNGVYLGSSSREAIVVDGKSQALREVYGDVAAGLRWELRNNRTVPVEALLRNVTDKVQEVMPYDGEAAERISREYQGDQLVGLSRYVNEEAGVCRHQGLMAAYVIENLIRDNHITGNVGVERNTNLDVGGTHAWAVYTPEHGNEDAHVVDPAHDFVGTKAQARREGRWEYSLSSD